MKIAKWFFHFRYNNALEIYLYYLIKNVPFDAVCSQTEKGFDILN